MRTKIIMAGLMIAGSFILNSAITNAQEGDVVLPKVKISGLIKTDFFFDERQTVCAREGHFLLFPAAPLIDPEGKDINDKSSYNFLPIQSILSVAVTGPVTLGATTSALIEGDFFGQSNLDVNMLRMRHAYIKLQWPKTELILGQYWHPLFVTSCYPGTVSFNTGSPIQPFARAPQIRFSYIPGILRLSGTLLSQRDYVSVGPEGPSSKYLRDSGIPEIQLSGEITLKKQTETIFGTVLGYKQIIPQIKTGKGFRTSQMVPGLSASIYFKHVAKILTTKLEAIYLENGSEYLAISGYVVKDSVDISKGFVNYTPIKTASCWAEIHTNGKLIQAGFFAGYTENMGTGSDVKGPFYLTSNMPVKSLYRLSPRLLYKPGLLSFALEVEYTSALYGTPADNGSLLSTNRVSNTRILLSALYKF